MNWFAFFFTLIVGSVMWVGMIWQSRRNLRLGGANINLTIIVVLVVIFIVAIIAGLTYQPEAY